MKTANSFVSFWVTHAPYGSFKQMADHHLSSSKAQDLEQSSLSDLVLLYY
jgi:hypothetical protein